MSLTCTQWFGLFESQRLSQPPSQEEDRSLDQGKCVTYVQLLLREGEGPQSCQVYPLLQWIGQ